MVAGGRRGDRAGPVQQASHRAAAVQRGGWAALAGPALGVAFALAVGGCGPGRAGRVAQPDLPDRARVSTAGHGGRPGREQGRRDSAAAAAVPAAPAGPAGDRDLGGRPGRPVPAAGLAPGPGACRRVPGAARDRADLRRAGLLPGGPARLPLRRRLRADRGLGGAPARAAAGAGGRRARPEHRGHARARAAVAAHRRARRHSHSGDQPGYPRPDRLACLHPRGGGRLRGAAGVGSGQGRHPDRQLRRGWCAG